MQFRHLEQAERHVAEGERHLADQERRIADMRRHGRDTTVAYQLLLAFRASQEQHIVHRDMILRELGR